MSENGMRLRPHHIHCAQFIRLPDPHRGTYFEKAHEAIDELFRRENGSIEVVEGPDVLCVACCHFDGQVCVHPRGNESQVRKWDAKILEGLELRPGQVMSVRELKSLIHSRSPLSFCLTKCAYHRMGNCDGGIQQA